MSKQCFTCGFVFDKSCFVKDKYKKDGLKNKCRQCEKERRYELMGKPVPTPPPPTFNEKGEKRCTKCENYLSTNNFYLESSGYYSSYCKVCNSESNKKNYDVERQKAYNKEYNKNNKERIKEANKIYSEKNKDSISKKKAEYYKNNRDIISKKKREHYREKYNNNKLFRLSESYRRGILSIFSGKTKSKRTLKILGCTYKEFKKHIESQFLNWMNWDNYGIYCGELNCGWDLDHIIPISKAQTEEELYLLNHWSNFQPMCSKTNRDVKNNTLYPCTNLELNITYE